MSETLGQAAPLGRGAAIATAGGVILVLLGAIFGGVHAASSMLPAPKPEAPPPSNDESGAQRGGPAPTAGAIGAETLRVNDTRVALGRAIFFDPAFSVPEGTSCASCHDPKRGFAGNHGSKIGVALGSRPGHFARRNTPSVLYLRFVRKFHLHWEEDAPLVDAYGGFFWDGRTDSLVELVKQPLLNPDEMNSDPTHAAAAIAKASYGADFRNEFGTALENPDSTLKAVGDAVAAYLLSPEMAPFSSRYDDYLRGQGQLTPLELQGLKLFKDSAKGGCSACHKLNDRSPDPKGSLFTDYEFDALAPPRNRALEATQKPGSFDLGLCERGGDDYKAKTEEFCGRFRTPSLRNVALRESFMHNGAFTKLRDVVAFYATRDTNPDRWYPGPKFDALPEKYRENVGVEKAPYNRQRGEAPALDEHEIDAVVAFLGTLTDAPRD